MTRLSPTPSVDATAVSHLVSCRQTTSGFSAATKASTFGARRRTELMFQLTILRDFDIRAA